MDTSDSSVRESTCPGCGLRMPVQESALYDGYYNTSPECWAVCTEVLGAEFGNAVIFGQVHQLTVDTYAVQHFGGSHPDKSMDVHLVGLHLQLEQGLCATDVPPLLQRLAASVDAWPHFEPPSERVPLTVCDVALAGSPQGHIETVRAWAAAVWATWAERHEAVADFAGRDLATASG